MAKDVNIKENIGCITIEFLGNRKLQQGVGGPWIVHDFPVIILRQSMQFATISFFFMKPEYFR